MSLIDKVRATLKSQDTEGPFELYVTRTPGFLWACLFKWLGVHPVAVTLISIAIGAASCWFFYSEDLGMNLIGMGLLVWANWYDCADGQLARMTGKRTLIGRILDGFCGDVWFFFIYLFLCLRMQGQNIPFTNTQWGVWIWLLGAWAGLRCHGRQCAIGDYYRNIHIYFLLGSGKAELDSEAKIKQEMNSMKWLSKDWFHKLYLYFYARYTGSQEAQVKSFHTMMQRLRERYGTNIPLPIREEFCHESRPLMPLANIITFDTRVIVLFLCIGFDIPWLYFIFESTVLEAARFHMIGRHERLCERITEKYTDK
jgi:hypothetical protein